MSDFLFSEQVDAIFDSNFLLSLIGAAAVFTLVYRTIKEGRSRYGFHLIRGLVISCFLFFYAVKFYFGLHHVWTLIIESALLGLVWGLWSTDQRT